jgi:hypothetical protein
MYLCTLVLYVEAYASRYLVKIGNGTKKWTEKDFLYNAEEDEMES